MKVPDFDVELPPLLGPTADENTPEKEILDGMLETYEKIHGNIRNVKTQAKELKTDCDSCEEEELRTEFKRAMDTLLAMTETLEYAYDHVRIVSVILRAKE